MAVHLERLCAHAYLARWYPPGGSGFEGSEPFIAVAVVKITTPSEVEVKGFLSKAAPTPSMWRELRTELEALGAVIGRAQRHGVMRVIEDRSLTYA